MPGTRKRRAGQTVGHRDNEAELTVLPARTLPEATTDLPTPPKTIGGGELHDRALERWSAFWASSVGRAVDPTSDLERLYWWAQCIHERIVVGEAIAAARVIPSGRFAEIAHVATDERPAWTERVSIPQRNPLMMYLRQMSQEIALAESEFGMTPSARFKLGIEYAEAGDAFARMKAHLDEVAGTGGDDDLVPTEFDEN